MCDDHESNAWTDADEEALIDAMIEDTVHCRLCGCSMLCGDNECLMPDGLHYAICAGCAESVAKSYQEYLDEY